MRIKNINIRAFTLLEILLASVIFIVTIAGVFTTLNALRKPVLDRENALAASVFGKQVLEALRSQVNTGSYYTSCTSTYAGVCLDFSLSLGTHEIPEANLTSLGLNWPGNLANYNNSLCGAGCLIYTVNCADNNGVTDVNNVNCGQGADMGRQVTLNINWPDTP